MISAWWLMLIILITFIVGYILCGIMVTGIQEDRCSKCLHKKEGSK